jgi:KipI family sensor histidine kinase inhibitor
MLQSVRYGPHALLLRFADSVGDETFQRGRAIMEELKRHPPAGLVECVPGFTTVLIRFQPDQTDNLRWLGRYLVDQLSEVAPGAATLPAPRHIPVVYDGEDLESLADEKGLSVSELIRLHCEPVYKVYLLGFSPGFPYLGDLPPRLHTPRRPTPRPRVPAGSVAIGGEHTGIYSVDSPGGWHIIGHTEVRMFAHEEVREDSDPEKLFFLKPGDRVRFAPVTEGSA